VASDIGIDEQYISANNLKTQDHLNSIADQSEYDAAEWTNDKLYGLLKVTD
jgi:hypothetical protein